LNSFFVNIIQLKQQLQKRNEEVENLYKQLIKLQKEITQLKSVQKDLKASYGSIDICTDDDDEEDFVEITVNDQRRSIIKEPIVDDEELAKSLAEAAQIAKESLQKKNDTSSINLIEDFISIEQVDDKRKSLPDNEWEVLSMSKIKK